MKEHVNIDISMPTPPIKTRKTKGSRALQTRIGSDEDENEEEFVFEQVAILNTGYSFGELALLDNKPRAARILCITDCHFAVMNKEDYNKSLSKIEHKKRIRNIQFLAEIPFFSS